MFIEFLSSSDEMKLDIVDQKGGIGQDNQVFILRTH